MLSVGGGNAMLDQQSYYFQDLRTAQALVHKGRILPLVMECFDVSIKLLADVFTHLLSREYLQEFLTNEEMRHRNERRKPKHDDDEEDEEDDEEEDDNEENLQQDQHQSQQQRRLSDEKSTTGGNNKDEIDMNALRMQATQVWMPQQFEFYRTLVLHFTKLVTESLTSVPHTTLTQAEVDQCFVTLNDKLGQTAAAAAARGTLVSTRAARRRTTRSALAGTTTTSTVATATSEPKGGAIRTWCTVAATTTSSALATTARAAGDSAMVLAAADVDGGVRTWCWVLGLVVGKIWEGLGRLKIGNAGLLSESV